MIYIIGIDSGINSSGIVFMNRDSEVIASANIYIDNPNMIRRDKIRYMAEQYKKQIEEFIHKYTAFYDKIIFVVEDHNILFGKNTTSICDLNKLDGRLEEIISSYLSDIIEVIDYVYINIKHIKQYILKTVGKSIKKENIPDVVMKNYGTGFFFEYENPGDVADAYILAMIGLDLINYVNIFNDIRGTYKECIKEYYPQIMNKIGE